MQNKSESQDIDERPNSRVPGFVNAVMYLCRGCILSFRMRCRALRELKARGIYTQEQMNGQLPITHTPSYMTMIEER